jgi:hypothetical protein
VGGAACATARLLTRAAPRAHRFRSSCAPPRARLCACTVAAGSNNNASQGPSKNTSKLDAETEELHRARPAAPCASPCAQRTRAPVPVARKRVRAHASPLTPRRRVAPADDRVSTELKTNLMKARLEKKMTQAQLAQVRARARVRSHADTPPSSACAHTPFLRPARAEPARPRPRGRPPASHPIRFAPAQQINELPKIVQDYESGKAIPNQAVRASRGTRARLLRPPRRRRHALTSSLALSVRRSSARWSAFWACRCGRRRSRGRATGGGGGVEGQRCACAAPLHATAPRARGAAGARRRTAWCAREGGAQRADTARCVCAKTSSCLQRRGPLLHCAGAWWRCSPRLRS